MSDGVAVAIIGGGGSAARIEIARASICGELGVDIDALLAFDVVVALLPDAASARGGGGSDVDDTSDAARTTPERSVVANTDDAEPPRSKPLVVVVGDGGGSIDDGMSIVDEPLADACRADVCVSEATPCSLLPTLTHAPHHFCVLPSSVTFASASLT